MSSENTSRSAGARGLSSPSGPSGLPNPSKHQVFTIKELDLRACTFSSPTKCPSGATRCDLQIGGRSVIVQTPKLLIKSISDSSVGLYLHQTREKARAFYNFMACLEDIAVLNTVKNSRDWFKNEYSRAAVDSSFRSLIKNPLCIDDPFVINFPKAKNVTNLELSYHAICLVRIDGIEFRRSSSRLAVSVIHAKLASREEDVVAEEQKISFSNDAASVSMYDRASVSHAASRAPVAQSAVQPETPVVPPVAQPEAAVVQPVVQPAPVKPEAASVAASVTASVAGASPVKSDARSVAASVAASVAGTSPVKPEAASVAAPVTASVAPPQEAASVAGASPVIPEPVTAAPVVPEPVAVAPSPFDAESVKRDFMVASVRNDVEAMARAKELLEANDAELTEDESDDSDQGLDD